jgi:hypothetical protein
MPELLTQSGVPMPPTKWAASSRNQWPVNYRNRRPGIDRNPWPVNSRKGWPVNLGICITEFGQTLTLLNRRALAPSVRWRDYRASQIRDNPVDDIMAWRPI